MSFTHALKWSFLSELGAKIIQPLVFIVLARLLVPEDFGVMASAMMVIAFSQTFWEAGIGMTIVQRQTNIKEAANAAFIINLCLGILIGSLLFLSAEAVAQFFFQDGRVTAVLKLMTLQVLFGALSSVPTALLQKEMEFKKLFWVRLLTIGLPGMASIPLAWSGWGYWALVVGTLMGQFVQVIVLWRIGGWRPGRVIDKVVTKEIAKFGTWVGITGLLTWFYAWADALVIGHYLGSHNLGIYRIGGQVPSMVFTLFFGPVMPVLYSYLSKIGYGKDEVRQVADLSLAILTCIAIPTALIIYMFSSHLEQLLFGSKWHGVGVVIGLMALMQGFSWIVGLNGEFYRSLGKPSYETIVTAGSVGIYLVVYLAVVKHGLEAFVWARMILAIGAMIIHLLLLKKMLKVDIGSAISRILLIAIVVSTIIWLMRELGILLTGNQWIQLLFFGGLSAITSAGFVYAVEKERIFRCFRGAQK